MWKINTSYCKSNTHTSVTHPVAQSPYCTMCHSYLRNYSSYLKIFMHILGSEISTPNQRKIFQKIHVRTNVVFEVQPHTFFRPQSYRYWHLKTLAHSATIYNKEKLHQSIVCSCQTNHNCPGAVEAVRQSKRASIYVQNILIILFFSNCDLINNKN